MVCKASLWLYCCRSFCCQRWLGAPTLPGSASQTAWVTGGPLPAHSRFAIEAGSFLQPSWCQGPGMWKTEHTGGPCSPNSEWSLGRNPNHMPHTQPEMKQRWGVGGRVGGNWKEQRSAHRALREVLGNAGVVWKKKTASNNTTVFQTRCHYENLLLENSVTRVISITFLKTCLNMH